MHESKMLHRVPLIVPWLLCITATWALFAGVYLIGRWLWHNMAPLLGMSV